MFSSHSLGTCGDIGPGTGGKWRCSLPLICSSVSLPGPGSISRITPDLKGSVVATVCFKYLHGSTIISKSIGTWMSYQWWDVFLVTYQTHSQNIGGWYWVVQEDYWFWHAMSWCEIIGSVQNGIRWKPSHDCAPYTKGSSTASWKTEWKHVPT